MGSELAVGIWGSSCFLEKPLNDLLLFSPEPLESSAWVDKSPRGEPAGYVYRNGAGAVGRGMGSMGQVMEMSAEENLE